MIENINYKEVENKCVDEQTAIAIASQDRNLKDYIFLKWKQEDNIVLGLIEFKKFKVLLAYYCYRRNIWWYRKRNYSY